MIIKYENEEKMKIALYDVQLPRHLKTIPFTIINSYYVARTDLGQRPIRSTFGSFPQPLRWTVNYDVEPDHNSSNNPGGQFSDCHLDNETCPESQTTEQTYFSKLSSLQLHEV